MDIAIIGDGNVGTALHKGLKDAGIEAPTTGKDPQRVRELAKGHDVIFLAVPWKQHEAVVREMGDVKGKVLVDVSNALDDDGGFADPRPSLAERLQKNAKGAHVVKAFNTVFAQNMAKGQVQGEALSLFVAGDDDRAKKTVQDVGRKMGFDPIDAGPLANARWLETLGFFNIRLGYGQEMGTDIGFKLVHPATKQQRTTTAATR